MDLQKLLGEMTLAEKIGQLVQLTPNFFEESSGEGEITGPLQELGLTQADLYQIGSVLGTHTKEQVLNIQTEYLKNSRLGIPLMFMADVIHGYETIFPVPLALASSWNPEHVEEVASLSGYEASEAGVHVTFSPMADLVRDARWGRVMESTGEDPYLNSVMAAAFVKGYQGTNEQLKDDFRKIAACVKHFIGYGAAEGGRDYNTVDISDINLYQYYLPSFEAALAAGAKLVMTSFNTINGMPATGNKKLMRSVLRRDLGFEGVLISDWGAIWEMIPHGVARDLKVAAKRALEAGVDIDMMTPAYQQSLAELIKEQSISEDLIDEAVLRVLALKEELGLFNDPYRGLKEKSNFNQDSLRQKTRESATKSMVLLKNETGLLPLDPSQKISLVGPLATSHDVLGAWSWIGDVNQSVTLATGLSGVIEQLGVVGTADRTAFTSGEVEAMVTAAKNSDVVVVALGESSEETGEAASKSSITLPQTQLELLKKIAEVNHKVVTVLYNGRPLDLSDVIPESQSILEAWFPGTEAGNAVADILVGKVNPAGKLPMSFPVTTGQVPVYYNQLRTGRPMTPENKDQKYISRYLDVANEPMYPFGYGLSYTDFELSDIKQESSVVTTEEPVRFSFTVKNTGNVVGVETLQCYIRATAAEIARPKRELKHFQQITLEPGASQAVEFVISEADLAYVHSDLVTRADKEDYTVFIGTSSLAPQVGEVNYQ